MELSQIGSMVDLVNFFWERDRDKNGILGAGEMPDISQYDESHNNELLPWELMEAVNLARSSQIFSEPEIDSMLVLNADGKTFPCVDIGENTIVQGMMFSSWQMEGADVCFNDNGQISSGTLAVNANIDGIIYRAGHTGMQGTASWERAMRRPGITFHDNGQVHQGILVDNETIDDITYSCEWGTSQYYSIIFFENGEVQSGRLLSNFTPDNVTYDATYRAGTWIGFHENGHVAWGTLNEDANIGGVRFREGTDIYFFENEKVQSGTLDQNKTIHGIALKAGMGVEFYESGHVSAIYVEDTTFSYKGIGYVDNVTFFENGQVKEGYLASDQIINGIKFASGTLVEFYENGRVAHGTLAEGFTTAEGARYEAGQRVEFDENGTPHLVPPVLEDPGAI